MRTGLALQFGTDPGQEKEGGKRKEGKKKKSLPLRHAVQPLLEAEQS